MNKKKLKELLLSISTPEEKDKIAREDGLLRAKKAILNVAEKHDEVKDEVKGIKRVIKKIRQEFLRAFSAQVDHLTKIDKKAEEIRNELSQEIKDQEKHFKKELEKTLSTKEEIKRDLAERIDRNLRNVGQAPPQTLLGGSAMSKRYRDISIVAGTNMTITASDDDTNRRVSLSLVSSGGGSGTVTSVGSADGSVTVTNPTTTPDLSVAKAPVLSTARNIAGVAFDGSAAIAIPLANLSDVSISSPAQDNVLRYDSSLSKWINAILQQISAGPGINYFYDDTGSDITNYQTLNKSPENKVEQDISAVANNGRTLIKAFASASAGLGGTQIDAGEWLFDFYGYVDVIGAGFSSLDVDVYSRTSGGTETLLFNVNSGTLTSSTDLYTISTIQQAFSISATDRLVVKIYAKTTALINRTIHFVFAGTTHYSNFSVPLVLRHNDLAGLQGGTASQYYHLTSAEYSALVTTLNTVTLTNKRITSRVVTAADATSITPNTDNADMTYQLNTQLAGTLTINADGGTPTNGQKWILKIKSTNAQTYSWNAQYVSGSDVTLPTTSTAGKIDNIGFMWDSVNSKWQCVAVARGY